MLHEKPNESFHWKNKLDDLDHLRGEQIPDKTPVWEKLHDRLREKPRSKMTLWYLTSAACLLLILGILWVMINRKDDNLVYNNRQPKQENPSIRRTPSIDNIVVIPLQKQTEKNYIITTKVKNKKFDLPVYKNVPIFKIDSIQKEISHNLVEEEYNISVNPDTIAIIAKTSVKKKLRVIHINELDNQVEDQIQFVRNNARPVSRMNSLNKDRLISFAASSNSSDNIVKIRLSPSN